MPFRVEVLILLGFLAFWQYVGSSRNYRLSVIFFREAKSVWV